MMIMLAAKLDKSARFLWKFDCINHDLLDLSEYMFFPAFYLTYIISTSRLDLDPEFIEAVCHLISRSNNSVSTAASSSALVCTYG